MNQTLTRFLREDAGQDLIEYVLLGALIATAVTVGATALGTQLNGWYQAAADWCGRKASQVPTT